jgi:hypothetical protein
MKLLAIALGNSIDYIADIGYGYSLMQRLPHRPITKARYVNGQHATNEA